MSRTPCTSHVIGSTVCADGFPQSAACAVVNATPICCDEERCGRLYSHCGGQPPERPVQQGLSARTTAIGSVRDDIAAQDARRPPRV